jgi:hypothetical protein
MYACLQLADVPSEVYQGLEVAWHFSSEYFGHVFPDGSWQTLSAISDSMHCIALLAHAYGFLVPGFQLQRNPSGSADYTEYVLVYRF